MPKCCGRFAARMPFQAWVAPSAHCFALCAVTRRLETLTEQSTVGRKTSPARRITCRSPFLRRCRRDLQRSVRIDPTRPRAADQGGATHPGTGPAVEQFLSPAPHRLKASAPDQRPVRLLAEDGGCWSEGSRRAPTCGWPMPVWTTPCTYTIGPASVHKQSTASAKRVNRHLRRAL